MAHCVHGLAINTISLCYNSTRSLEVHMHCNVCMSGPWRWIAGLFTGNQCHRLTPVTSSVFFAPYIGHEVWTHHLNSDVVQNWCIKCVRRELVLWHDGWWKQIWHYLWINFLMYHHMTLCVIDQYMEYPGYCCKSVCSYHVVQVLLYKVLCMADFTDYTQRAEPTFGT